MNINKSYNTEEKNSKLKKKIYLMTLTFAFAILFAIPAYATAPTVTYSVHGQNYGWQAAKKDGAIAGTTGKSLRLEAVRIKVSGIKNLGISYRSHVQNIGWEKKWNSNGAISGTTGQSKRMEAIQIKLTGSNASKYDVYYCLHSQDLGWLNWAKNGAYAGTANGSKRAESICIKIQEKGSPAPKKLGTREYAYIILPNSLIHKSSAQNGDEFVYSEDNYEKLKGYPIIDSTDEILSVFCAKSRGESDEKFYFYSHLSYTDLLNLEEAYHQKYLPYGQETYIVNYVKTKDKDITLYEFYTAGSKNFYNIGKRYEEMAKIICESAVKQGMNERQKAIAINNELCRRMTYKETSQSEVLTNLNNWCGVCAQYSHIYWASCKYAGLKCETVSGKVGEIHHTWNRVRINGKWYWNDSTWNEQGNRYLLSEKIWEDRTITRYVMLS